MNVIARIAVLGLLLTGITFAKHRDRSYYRNYDRSYQYSRSYPGNYAYRNYGYRNYGYNTYRVPPGLANRRYQDLPPGIQKKLRREAIRQRYDSGYYWRGW